MTASASLPPPVPAAFAAAALWQAAGLPPAALARLHLPGREPVLASSFAVASALQASLGVAALAAAEWGRRCGGPAQQVTVAADDVVCEATGAFTLDGAAPELWDKLSGLYRCGEGWVRLHANFTHHRDGALRLLGLPEGEGTERVQVEQALQGWAALRFEQAAAEAGLVVAALRSRAEWLAHPQAAAVAALPPVRLQRVGAGTAAVARSITPSSLPAGARPLQGLRVLDLTRILAGPVAGRTLAAYGADVMLVNSPGLPNIAAIADTSRGKLSVHVDLKTTAGRDTLRALVREADVFLQGYRPGALAALGLGADELLALNPRLVVASLSAYGDTGPWAGRRGFDSLVQTAIGLNHEEALAFGQAAARALPLQALDYGAGFLLAFGIVAARLRQAGEGGGCLVQVSLARTGQWLAELGRCSGFEQRPRPQPEAVFEASDSGFGRLAAVRHAARFSHTAPAWPRPSMPPGSHAPVWPPRA